MNKYIITFILLTVSLLAREVLFSIQEYSAFNHMKHTQNTHGVHLDTRLDLER
ncbi:hypothetical protein TSL6_09550 [Sulfurovum sp. TSL6]|uniref:hypothetical protein n=1 Tax=Sulfurovum sp. TSL6 TaxID=2826995 RepID=UPI001CC35571|nr:hypothetical protein [Sulfurovum sp. TSL6]GIU00449.1 hypothetical protein TSL6_09550 [Sulfurovum sp. TSL6]